MKKGVVVPPQVASFLGDENDRICEHLENAIVTKRIRRSELLSALAYLLAVRTLEESCRGSPVDNVDIVRVAEEILKRELRRFRHRVGD